MAECIFCKIINKKIPSEVIYEDSHALSILDVYPIAPGHAMVLPKIHSENLLDLPEEELGAYLSAVKKTAEKISKAINPDGFTMGINHGEASGQVVKHLHFHIIPRWKNDGGKSLHGVVNNKPKESVSEIADKIRKTAYRGQGSADSVWRNG